MLYNTLFIVISLLAFGLFAVILGNPVKDLTLFIQTLLMGSIGFSISFTFISAIASKANWYVNGYFKLSCNYSYSNGSHASNKNILSPNDRYAYYKDIISSLYRRSFGRINISCFHFYGETNIRFPMPQYIVSVYNNMSDADYEALLPLELAFSKQLKAQGSLQKVYAKAAHRGAILIMEAANEAELKAFY